MSTSEYFDNRGDDKFHTVQNYNYMLYLEKKIEVWCEIYTMQMPMFQNSLKFHDTLEQILTLNEFELWNKI